MDRCNDCDGFIYGYCHHCKKGENMAEIKDSGTRRTFESGAVRDMSGAEKGDFSLLPWEVIWDLAKHYSKGLEKYGRDNWKKGIPTESYFDSGIRHLVKHQLGWTDEDHAIAALWNIACMIWEERYSPRAKEEKKAEDARVDAAAAYKNAVQRAFISSPDFKCEKCGGEMNKGYAVQVDGKIMKICSTCYLALGK